MTITDNESAVASFTLAPTEDLYFFFVANASVNIVRIPTRSGSFARINGVTQPSGVVLQQRVDTPALGATLEVSIHEGDIGAVQAGNGTRDAFVFLYFKDGSSRVEQIPIEVQRNTLQGSIKWIGVSTLGGYIQYENISSSAAQVTICWKDGQETIVPVTPESGLIWIPAPELNTDTPIVAFSNGFSTGFLTLSEAITSGAAFSNGFSTGFLNATVATPPTGGTLTGTAFNEGFDAGFEPEETITLGSLGLEAYTPKAITLQSAGGAESSSNLLNPNNAQQYELNAEKTKLMKWAVPPRINVNAEGFKPFYTAFEAGLDLNPEGVEQELNPLTSSRRFLSEQAALYGARTQPNEPPNVTRSRILSILKSGKDNPETLKEILELILDVTVSIADTNDDGSIGAGYFNVVLGSAPAAGIEAASQIIKRYRSAGRIANIRILNINTENYAVLTTRFAILDSLRLQATLPTPLAGFAIPLDGSYLIDGSWQIGQGKFTEWEYGLNLTFTTTNLSEFSSAFDASFN